MQLGIALREILILVLVAIAAIVTYSNSIDGAFIFDDQRSIVDNVGVHNLGPFSKYFSSTRPITDLSFALNYHFNGLEVASYHYVNICVHVLASCFLYGLLRLTFCSPVFAESIRENAVWIAAIAALVWSVHPLNTQAVTYIVQRAESMMGMSMFAFLFFIAATYHSSRKPVWLILAFLAFCFGIGCKPVMVMALPIGLLFERSFFSESWSQLFRKQWWFWTLCALPLAFGLVVVLPGIVAGQGAAGFGLKSVSPLEYLATQPQVILHYLRLMVWPDPLIFDYGWPIETDSTTIAVTGGILGLVVLGLIGLYFKKAHWAFWGMAFLLVLMPTSTFLPLQDLAVEHRAYVSTAFFVSAVVALLFVIGERFVGDNTRLLLGCLFGLIICGLGYLTIQRNLDYHQPEIMWQDVIEKTVDAGRENIFAGRTYCNLGKVYGDQKNWDESIKWLQLALEEELFPTDVYGNLARAHLAQGDVAAAKQSIITAISMDPENAKLIQQAGLVSAREKDHAQAEFHFRRALELKPKDKLILMNLAQSLVAQRKMDEAIQSYQAAIDLDPRFVEARRRQLKTMLRVGKVAEAETALADYRTSFAQDPYIDFYQAEILLQQKKLPEAIPLWEKSLAADPPPTGVHYQLGNAYRFQGQLDKAQRYYENAVRYEPNNVQALNNLGGLLAAKDPRLAIGYFERVVALAPSFIQARYNIASLSLQLGEQEKAHQVLQGILDEKPDFEPAKQLLESLQSAAVQEKGSEKTEAVGAGK